MTPQTSDHSRDRYRHLTLLHSNDLHGDFLAEELDEKLVGGVSMLSGYINQVRQESPNTLYMIAGDMFRGSLIDSEFQGISTIEIMNALGPDIVSLGNHEVDYGIAHLLFLERCCKFPIVNANVYIRTLGARLFQSHRILEVDGMRILVIGILTSEIMEYASGDTLLGTFIDVQDAVQEVGIICDSYQRSDIDFTILLTHIGYENDILLAKSLNPDWGVDIIIGGHSHTLLEEPTSVNGTLIVQAGTGTDQIGRFEIVVDTKTASIHSYTWKTVPINSEHCQRNTAIEDLILNYKKITDEKYGEILTTMVCRAEHPSRYQETSTGNLFADLTRDAFELDLVMLGSGGIRKPEFGPVVTRGELLDVFPFDEKLLCYQLTGAEIKHAISFMFEQLPINTEGCHAEFYQISSGFRFVYHATQHRLLTATFLNEPIHDDQLFSVGMVSYHAANMDKFLDLDPVAIQNRCHAKTLSSNLRISLEEHIRRYTHLIPAVDGRLQRIIP